MVLLMNCLRNDLMLQAQGHHKAFWTKEESLLMILRVDYDFSFRIATGGYCERRSSLAEARLTLEANWCKSESLRGPHLQVAHAFLHLDKPSTLLLPSADRYDEQKGFLLHLQMPGLTAWGDDSAGDPSFRNFRCDPVKA